MSTKDPTPSRRGKVAADGAIGNRDSRTAAKDIRYTGNTALRIAAHRGAEDRRSHNSKFLGGNRNTAEGVVAYDAIPDRQRAAEIINPIRTVPDGQARDRCNCRDRENWLSGRLVAVNRELVGARP